MSNPFLINRLNLKKEDIFQRKESDFLSLTLSFSSAHFSAKDFVKVGFVITGTASLVIITQSFTITGKIKYVYIFRYFVS